MDTHFKEVDPKLISSEIQWFELNFMPQELVETIGRYLTSDNWK